MTTEGECSCCRVNALLCPGGPLGQPICAACTFTHGIAAETLTSLLGLGLGTVVQLESERVDLTAPHAAMQLARILSLRYRRLGPDGLFNWSGEVVFPDIRAREVLT